MSVQHLVRTTEAGGARTLHLSGCARITLGMRLRRRVSAWGWADGRDLVTLLAVTEATRVKLCPVCAPLRISTVPAPRGATGRVAAPAAGPSAVSPEDAGRAPRPGPARPRP